MNDEIFDMMIKDLKQLNSDRKRLIDVLKKLVEQIDLVTISPGYQAAFILLFSRGMEYTGPTWETELEKAKEVLKELAV